ncbi:uncharacterized protein [Henckelia pumila]|uniref:uncharacterized protein n=1 Tax=Henckelia pumila TaxID=405737 RepID=UPI003C6E52FB
MRQRRWMNLLKNCDCEIKYHPGSYNPVVDALIRKVYLSSLSTSAVSHVVEDCCSFGFTFRHNKEQHGVCVSSVLAEPALYTRIREAQIADPKTQKLARLAQDENNYGFYFQADGLLCLFGRVVVLDDSTLKEDILSQAHCSRFFVHPGTMKMSRQNSDDQEVCFRVWRLLSGSGSTMARLYVQDIVRLHGIPLSIVSDRDPRFTSKDHLDVHVVLLNHFNLGIAAAKLFSMNMEMKLITSSTDARC